ncbi:MAG TPA: hypothetical protein VK166_00745 [Chitinophagaceae bacterium]|nr:hypothetical protein [Chitinophagaceae bacterium]
MLQAQTGTCILKETRAIINFGNSDAIDINTRNLNNYRRVYNTCPTDGHYSYASSTSDCFRGDWITLNQDHTPGDNDGQMLLVNASYHSGEFFNTTVSGLKGGAHYEFSIWMLNLCRPSEKCPFPLLPNITIQVMSSAGKLVFELNTGNLPRSGRPDWNKFDMMFTMPKGESNLFITMINYSPGGCGNDFAVDDITFRECVLTPPPVERKALVPTAKKSAPLSNNNVKKSDSPLSTPVGKKNSPSTPVKKSTSKPVTKAVPPATGDQKKSKASKPAEITRTEKDSSTRLPVTRTNPPPAPILNRSNPVVKKFETGPGEIKIELFDNGQIDGDTVSVYHNNILVLSRVRLSEKALSFTIKIDSSHPHHELVMVANNLGSIPPNTSLMYVIAETRRYEVFISSDEQTNARIVFDLKKE